LPEGSEYQLDLDLCGNIIPEQSSYKFLPTRLDITLKKDNSCRWANLERVEGKFKLNLSIPRSRSSRRSNIY